MVSPCGRLAEIISESRSASPPWRTSRDTTPDTSRRRRSGYGAQAAQLIPDTSHLFPDPSQEI
jgi:hypothetical protein